MTTREHPIWKEVARKISERVDTEGYGFLITMESLLELLEHPKPTILMSHDDYSAYVVEKMVRIEGLKDELSCNYNIHLQNEYKEGYIVAFPDDQVSKGFDRHYKKARKQIKKGVKVLINVDHENLTATGIKNRDRNIGKSIFVLKAMNKRNIPMQKLIDKD